METYTCLGTFLSILFPPRPFYSLCNSFSWHPQATFNPSNTVYDAKRLIGRQFDEDQVKEDIAHFPFSVTRGKDGSPAIAVRRKDQVG